jgi:glycosyltransferase involved in cell wall biosynthesis
MKQAASVVIPVLNGAATIARTIESALAQDYSGEFEVVVVDNGSTDSTREIVARYPVSSVEEPSRGRSQARNRGARETRGELLGFVDADCELPRVWLEEAARALARSWVGAAQARIAKHGTAPPPPEFVHARHFLPFLDTCALVVQRSAFEAAGGFDPELRRNEDMDFSFRLLACGYALSVLPGAIAIKHHDLDYEQAVRRGWQDGLALALVDRKWRSRMPPAAERRLGAMKYWAQRLLSASRGGAPERWAIAEKTAGLAGYLSADLFERGAVETAGRPVTRLPAALGPGRSLVCIGDHGLLYDAKRRVEHRLDHEALSAVASLIDADPPDPRVAERLLRQLP